MLAIFGSDLTSHEIKLVPSSSLAWYIFVVDLTSWKQEMLTYFHGVGQI